MTLNSWINFNKEVLNCDLLVVILNNSFKIDDKIIEAYLSIENANEIFGNYELKKVLVGHKDNSDHFTIKVVLWKSTKEAV